MANLKSKSTHCRFYKASFGSTMIFDTSYYDLNNRNKYIVFEYLVTQLE